MRGGSVIYSPMGEVLAGPNFEGPVILYADLDRGEIARAKFDFDVVGHYARPDVFRLQVDETSRVPVVLAGGQDIGTGRPAPPAVVTDAASGRVPSADN